MYFVHVYMYCVHVLCTRIVYMYCVHVLCTCIHVLCTCIVYMYCVHVLCTCIVYMYCVHVHVFTCTCACNMSTCILYMYVTCSDCLQNMSILEIAAELNRLHALGLKGQLTPADIVGGTFSLSNFGAVSPKVRTNLSHFSDTLPLDWRDLRQTNAPPSRGGHWGVWEGPGGPKI